MLKKFLLSNRQLKRVNRISKLIALADKPKSVKRKVSFSKDFKRVIFESQNHRCAYCFRNLPLTLDHVISLSMGGDNSFTNIVGACNDCNQTKREIDGYSFYYMLHKTHNLVKILENLFRSQPLSKKRIPTIIKYRDSLYLTVN